MLHIYGVHLSKEAVLAAPALLSGYAPESVFRRADIYLQHSISLAPEGSTASATDVVVDSRSLLVSFSSGSCQVYSWAGKVTAPAAAFFSLWLCCRANSAVQLHAAACNDRTLGWPCGSPPPL